MTSKNEAGVDHDFDAAVHQLRQGDRGNALKFGAILLLTLIFAAGLFAFALTVGDTVKEIFSAAPAGNISDLEE